jgi:glycosyltransferase involved in cell wall biosynthesis
MSERSLRIGLVSTRFAGTDGVSLESAKWSQVLTELGHECFYFAGESDRPADRSRVVPEAHFQHPLVQRITSDLFDDYRRSARTTEAIHDLWLTLKRALSEFIGDFKIDLLLVENALAIPMNVPLGLALTNLIAETAIPTIAHHHDFVWERERFALSAAEDYLAAAFPPRMPSIQNVVINSFGAEQLALRTGQRSALVPNVMDFDNPPPEHDGYDDDLRQSLAMKPDEVFILQPTRVVPRKRIERAIELAYWMALPCRLVVTHSAGDEGGEYQAYLEEYARVMKVPVVFAAEHFSQKRGTGPDGRKIYSLEDAYRHADLVTYPSLVEGFGNAFLETIYYRRPILMSDYEIFKTDIQPKGFKVIGFGAFIHRQTIEHARQIVSDPKLAEEMVEHNYELGRRYYSFSVLRERLRTLVRQCMEGTF